MLELGMVGSITDRFGKLCFDCIGHIQPELFSPTTIPAKSVRLDHTNEDLFTRVT